MQHTRTVVAVAALALPSVAAAGLQTIARYDATVAPIAPDPQSPAGGSWSIVPEFWEPSEPPSPVFDGGVPAWRLADTSISGGLGGYRHNLTPSELGAIAANGWEMSATLRMVSGGSNAEWFAPSMYLGFVDASGRWDVWFDLTNSGRLEVSQFLGDSIGIVAAVEPGPAATDYHTIAIRLLPGESTATVHLDGLLVGALPDSGIPGDLPAAIRWGAGSTGGDGTTHFRTVELRAIPAPSGAACVLMLGALCARRRRTGR